MHGYGVSESRVTNPLDKNHPLEESRSLIGTIVDGRYRLTGVLGRGGMATVFRAEHITIKRPVALKLLQPSIGNVSDFAARFEREAYALGRLEHPNCVAVVDYGRTNHVAYLVMDLVDGNSLATILDDERRLPWRRALRLCRDVLEGLACAHAKGIVHRDIKPQNVVVATDGDRECAKVLDFGIAKLLGDDNSGSNKLTAIGTAIGTPTYISPEQAIGDSVDVTADLYSVSVMLYELIAGHAPYRSAEPMQVVFQHINAPIPSLAGEVHEIPDGLDALVREGMAKRPSQRIATAREYLARIDALLRGPDVAPIALMPETATRRAPGGRIALRTVGLIAAVVAAVAVVGSMSAERAAPELAPAPARESAPESARAPAPESAPALAPAPESAPAPALAPALAPAPESARSALDARRAAAAAARLRAGHKYIAKLWWSEAFDEYRAAIAIDPSLREDPTLIRNALKSFQSRRHPSLGIRFIRDEIGDAAVPHLRAAAKNKRSLRLSRRSAALLKEMGH